LFTDIGVRHQFDMKTVSVAGFSIVSALALAAGCASTSMPDTANAGYGYEEPVIADSQASVSDEVAAPAASLPRWCSSGEVVTKAAGNGSIVLESSGRRASAADATVTEININGDEHLELFVRDACKRGERCSYRVYAACGNGGYALIPATGLVGDRLDTSMQGILIDDVYWRDVLLYQFLTKGDRLGEQRIRYRYNGLAYHRHQLN